MPTTSFSNQINNVTNENLGYVQADGFFSPSTLGTPIAGSTGGHSKGPAQFPYGMAPSVAVIAAAGATQGNATTVTAAVVEVTATASTEGIKLSTAFPQLYVYIPGAVGAKVYPPTNGKIGTHATNVGVVLGTAKGAVFSQITSTLWVAFTGTSF